MYEQLQKAVETGTISRKTACRTAIKLGYKNEYVALLLNKSLAFINYLIDIDDNYLDNFDGTEISMLTE